MWEINERGFLPEYDPLETINPGYIGSEFKRKYYTYINELSKRLPLYLNQRRWREEVVASLREFETLNISDLISPISGFSPLIKDHSCYSVIEKESNEDYIERLMRSYSYFASAYIYATHENPATRLPKEIAEPLVLLSKKIERHPILSYASYCLYNWKRIDPIKPIVLGNIELLQNFSEEYKEDEDWFILVHVDIEAKAGRGLMDIKKEMDNNKEETNTLYSIHLSLLDMNKTLARMPEHCRPEVYFNRVRPYIFGFENMQYEIGIGDGKVFNLRGETGAQSSIVPAFCAYLGVEHKDSLLTEHLTEMLEYMPKPHREFIQRIKDFTATKKFNFNDEKKKIYNSCIRELAKFRAKHLEYAVNYIQKKVKDPKGTGGTPYIPWLSQLVEETESFLME